MHRRPAGAEFNDDVPGVVALIDLDEKVRILAGVVGTPVDQVAIGQRVKVTFRPVNDQMALPMFEIAPQRLELALVAAFSQALTATAAQALTNVG
ncbi:MAG: OB-fold domain-containing protein [Alphaproteobacteria bacterium]